MSIVDLLVWTVFPYMALAVMCMGILWMAPMSVSKFNFYDKSFILLILFIAGCSLVGFSGTIPLTQDSSMMSWIKGLIVLDPVHLTSEHFLIKLQFASLLISLMIMPFTNIKFLVIHRLKEIFKFKQKQKNEITSSHVLHVHSNFKYQEQKSAFQFEKSIS